MYIGWIFVPVTVLLFYVIQSVRKKKTREKIASEQMVWQKSFWENATLAKVKKACKKLNINQQNDKGETLLILASEYMPLPEIIRYLIEEKQADVTLHDTNYRSAFFYLAGKTTDLDLIRFVADLYPDKKLLEIHAYSAMTQAVQYNPNLDVAEFIRSLGVDMTYRSSNGMSYLMYAVQNPNTEIIDFCLKHDIKLKSKDKEGNSVLHHAALFALSSDVIKKLIHKGLSVDDTNYEGQTPLMLSVMGDYTPEITSCLLKEGADINQQDANGETPLIYALRKPNTDIALDLIKKGADLSLKNADGDSAFSFVVRHGLLSLADFFSDFNLQNKKGISLVMKAVICRQMPMLRYLIEHGADINLVNHKEQNALYTAINSSKGENEYITCLIDNGIDLSHQDIEGNTALMHALYAGKKELAELLIDKGSPLDLKNKSGETAFSLTAQNPNYNDLHWKIQDILTGA